MIELTDDIYLGTAEPESSGGGGAVDSVNGYTGVVVLTASDVGVEAYTANEIETIWESI